MEEKAEPSKDWALGCLITWKGEMNLSIITHAIWILVLSGVGSSGAFATSIIAQNGPHDGWNVIPLSPSSGPGRYQQLYTSSLFSETVSIDGVAFSTHRDSFYSANITVRFTTTSTPVGELSSNLDSNYSTPLTTVFSDPAFSQAVTGGSESFGLVFDFDSTPFLYNPVDGNLLMDLLISNQILIPSEFPAFTGFSQGGTGTVYSRAWNTANFGQGSDSAGLRTKLEFSVVPEPTTLALTSLGLAAIGYQRRRKIRRHSCSI